MRFPQLDGRLKAVADFVRPGAAVCDIGSDHAAVLIELSRLGQNPVLTATDVNPRPLQVTKKRTAGTGIITILSDGFEHVTYYSPMDAIIAGMGGETIIGILERCPYSPEEIASMRFILQPMTKIDVLRSYLSEHNYTIIKEANPAAHGRTYTIFYVKKF